MKSYLLLAVFAVVAAAPAVAQEAQPRGAKAEKKICRTEKMTGSLTRARRICLTESEWHRMAEGTQDAVNDIIHDGHQADIQRMQDRPGGGYGGAGGMR